MRHARPLAEVAAREALESELTRAAGRVPIAAGGRVRIGTSGWVYPPWRGHFYPAGLPQHRELAHVASKLDAVEVNGTFYSLTRPSACDAWRRAVPPDFLFAIKGSRYITHMLKLARVEAPLANFFASGILRLGRQLGPLLWQLPPMLPFDAARAERFFAALPRTIADAERLARRHDARVTGRAALTAPDGRDGRLRHALEVRHESWLTDPALRLLEAHALALVVADTAGRHPFAIHATADFDYVRLHGSAELYRSRYRPGEIRAWARRVRGWRDAGRDVFVFFDNTDKRHAPDDALRLRAAVGRRRGPRAVASRGRRTTPMVRPGSARS